MAISEGKFRWKLVRKISMCNQLQSLKKTLLSRFLRKK